tara:strand:+ start:275 stop:496 length:222 start_codon:yes stop_codon:yes gene_type:complete
MHRILSRKFLISIGAIGSVLISAINGSVAWDAALPSIAAIAIGYCVSQGWVDGKSVEQEIKKLQADEKKASEQ